MSRRISLPGADELFRSTGGQDAEPDAASAAGAPGHDAARGAWRAEEARGGTGDGDPGDLDPLRAAVEAVGARDSAPADVGRGTRDAAGSEAPEDRAAGSRPRTGVRRRPRATGERRPTGRERHEEKITVYVSAEELLDLEHARLALRGEHGLAVDRGRIVREALAVVIADLDAKGEASILVRRLLGR